MISEIARRMESDNAAKGCKFGCDRLAYAVHGRLVVTGRLDLDQRADVGDYRLEALLEIGKTALCLGPRRGIRKTRVWHR